MTHQLVVVRRPCTPELRKAPPLALEPPALHLLIYHGLQCAVAHPDQRERRSAIEPMQALVTKYRTEHTCRAVSKKRKEKTRDGERTPEPTVRSGRVGRRGERPDLHHPYGIGQIGRHGTLKEAESLAGLAVCGGDDDMSSGPGPAVFRPGRPTALYSTNSESVVLELIRVQYPFGRGISVSIVQTFHFQCRVSAKPGQACANVGCA